MLLGYYLFCYILFCYVYNLVTTTYKFVLYFLSKVMVSVNFLKVLLYLLMRISLLMGHFSVRSTAAFSLYLSCSTSSQSLRSFVSCFVVTDGTKLILFKLTVRVQKQALPSASTQFVKKRILIFRIAITRSASSSAGQLPTLQHHQTLLLFYSNDLNFIAPRF
jgi:hypothetical protein